MTAESDSGTMPTKPKMNSSMDQLGDENLDSGFFCVITRNREVKTQVKGMLPKRPP